MGYNKAKAEKKWRRWKDAEEKELRRLGVNEDVIQRLREADREDFKAERRFFEHCSDMSTPLICALQKELNSARINDIMSASGHIQFQDISFRIREPALRGFEIVVRAGAPSSPCL